LCADAEDGQILVCEPFINKAGDLVESESLGELELKGFSQPLMVFNILSISQTDQLKLYIRRQSVR